MPTNYLRKIAGEVLDYPFNWAASLAAAESISTVATTIDPVETGGVVVDSGGAAHVSNIVSPVLSGGISGHRYVVECTITTNQGRTDKQQRTLIIA